MNTDKTPSPSSSKFKKRSILSIIDCETLYSLLENPLILFRTWYLVVYHPRDFFLYFFDSSSEIKLRTTILLGTVRYGVDTRQDKVFGPLWFILETSGIVISSVPIIGYIARNLRENRATENIKIPEITSISILDDLILGLLFVIMIYFSALSLGTFYYIFCKKGTSYRKLVDYAAYVYSASTLATVLGIVIAMFLFSIMWNRFPNDANFHSAFVLLFMVFGAYIFVFLYLFLEVSLRLYIANGIIVLREVFFQENWRVATIHGLPLFVGAVFMATASKFL